MRPEPRLSVFLNVPYDEEYRNLLDALVFTTVCCGFFPRSANESTSAGTPRITRIIEALTTSMYSVHDLSRCQGHGGLNLARFNMPLELGMAITHAYAGGQRHEWFALVLDGHPYEVYASDLIGYDLKSHSGTAASVIPPYMAWLLTREGAISDLSPHDVLPALPAFQTARKELDERWHGELPWWHLVKTATTYVPLAR